MSGRANMPLSGRRFSKAGRVCFIVFRTYIIILLSFVIMYPMLYMLSIAFRSQADFIDPGVVWIAKQWTLDNMLAVYELIEFPRALVNSVIIMLAPTALQLVSCSLAGYGLARFPFRGRGLIFALVLMDIIVPGYTIIVPLIAQIRSFDFFFIGQLGRLFGSGAWTVNLYNTPWALLVPAAFGNGLRGCMYIFIFRQFFMSLPVDLEDAASIDGCGFLQTFTRIVVPCASAPFLVVFILSAIWYWNDVSVTALFNPAMTTLSQAVDSLLTVMAMDYDLYTINQYQQAGCLFMIVPVLIMYVFLQRYFVQSIDRTGFK